MNQSTRTSPITAERDLSQSETSFDGRWLRIAQAIWLVLTLLVAGLYIWAVRIWITESGYSESSWLDVPYGILMPLGYFGIAIFIMARKPRDKMTLFTSLMLIFLGPYLISGVNITISQQPGWEILNHILLGVGGAIFLLFLLIFPDGHFVPAWIRWFYILITISYILGVFFSAEVYVGLSAGVILITIITGFFVQVYRYLHVSSPVQRQQTKWIVLGSMGPVLMILTWILLIVPGVYALPTDPIPFYLHQSIRAGLVLLFPVSLVFSIFRYRLWDIDIIINRTLVYATLTFATISLYVIVVGVFGDMLKLGDSKFIAFLTTGLVAILFQPLRERLQTWVNRLMYGERDDPVSVLSKLGEELEHTGSPEDALASIPKTVAQTLKLPYVAIELEQNKQIVASFGDPVTDVIRLPMQYQGEPSGSLIVTRRAPGESFSDLDNRLLENIARQAGAVAHAARLTANLRISYHRLVTAREEERRRMRRDLHDGLGPTLASLTLRVDAARNVLRTDPEKAEVLLDDLKKQTQNTIQDIRSMVYQLRPPALDEFGLLGTIQNFIDKQTASHPRIYLKAPGELPQLSAALEVAVYHIVMEGLNNVLRHADANKAVVKILINGEELLVEIEDDGVGFADGFSAGVGLTSMRERAEELGGSFQILPSQMGFHLRATLPIVKE